MAGRKLLIRYPADCFKHFQPAFPGRFQPSQRHAAFPGSGGHILPVMRFPRHLGGVCDEIPGAFAQPSGLPVFHHLFPASALVHNKHASYPWVAARCGIFGKTPAGIETSGHGTSPPSRAAFRSSPRSADQSREKFRSSARVRQNARKCATYPY